MKPSLLVLALLVLSTTAAQSLREGSHFTLNRQTLVITKLQALPLVTNDYSRRFKFDSAENPKLKELRERYRLDQVVAGGRDEFSKQVILNDWVHHQFRKFGKPSTSARGALEVLTDIQQGQTFFCAQYAETLASCAASLGWVDRLLALRRHQGVNARGGSTEHTTTEIWSNQHAKWIMLDPTSNMYLEKAGVPLNAWEIRQEWFYHNGTNLTFVLGGERTRYRKSDLPIFLAKFADFGDLTIDPDELDKYGFIGYIPNTNLMDAGNDYGAMFIVKDALCAGTKWHQRDLPANPAVDPYFPLGQTAIELKAERDSLTVQFATFTPNFARFEVKIDNRAWEPSESSLRWTPRVGKNQLLARTVNKFGVLGPESMIQVEAK